MSCTFGCAHQRLSFVKHILKVNLAMSLLTMKSQFLFYIRVYLLLGSWTIIDSHRWICSCSFSLNHQYIWSAVRATSHTHKQFNVNPRRRRRRQRRRRRKNTVFERVVRANWIRLFFPFIIWFVASNPAFTLWSKRFIVSSAYMPKIEATPNVQALRTSNTNIKETEMKKESERGPRLSNG